MAKTPDEISAALMNFLYHFVATASGDVDKAAKDPFVCWFKPGVPFEPEDFRFAQRGLNGEGATEEARAADAASQMTQAAGFSRFVDFVPSIDGVNGGNLKDGVLRPSVATLSDFYKRVLESSQVAQLPEPAGINARIQQMTDQLKPMKPGYNEHAEAYEAAKAVYVEARMKATYSPTDRLQFQAKGPVLKRKVVTALQDWETDGFKTQYENLAAEIESLRSKRSPALWRKEALDSYRAGGYGENAVFGEARLTMPYPGSFASAKSGWATFELKTEHIDKFSSEKSTKWSASGGVGWGSLKIGASGSGSNTQTLAIKNTNNFSLKMSVAQIPLLREWFDPWFLRSEFWRFNPASIEGQRNEPVSDGGFPPRGMIIAYPRACIFVKDVEITLDELKDEQSELVKTLKAEGKGGWGLGAINIGGSYERNQQEKKQKSDLTKGKVTAGLQMVGVNCELTGKSPNPKGGLTWITGA